MNDSQVKKLIVEKFEKQVKGKHPTVANVNSRHDGKEGHWLEKAMGLKLNGDNRPDIMGFEMKNDTTSKTTFGDWSASWYVFKSRANKEAAINRDEFLAIFGKPNEKKKGRLSWSGEPCPTIKDYNNFGQRLRISSSKDIIAEYSYSMDKRENKNDIVPECFRAEGIVLAKWNRADIQKRLEDKFNQRGWFKCYYSKDKGYFKIAFGRPISYDNWIEMVKAGTVFFDSGMYQGNNRPYSQWRANNTLWESLIDDVYDFEEAA
jgi:hypothetical protein